MTNYIKTLDKLDWTKVEELPIDKFNWNYDFKPLSKAKLCIVKNEGIYVRMLSYEDNPVSKHKQNDESVCEDSCLEFFFNAFPKESGIYLNFEVNHIGTMLICYGANRADRRFLSTLSLDYPQVNTFSGTDALGGFWGIEYLIPFDIISAVYNKSTLSKGHILKFGLYKCGDLTGRIHYGSWREIETDAPDFHRPEFFGALVVE